MFNPSGYITKDTPFSIPSFEIKILQIHISMRTVINNLFYFNLCIRKLYISL